MAKYRKRPVIIEAVRLEEQVEKDEIFRATYYRILTAPPGGGSWDSTKVNALLTGIEAVVP